MELQAVTLLPGSTVWLAVSQSRRQARVGLLWSPLVSPECCVCGHDGLAFERTERNETRHAGLAQTLTIQFASRRSSLSQLFQLLPQQQQGWPPA